MTTFKRIESFTLMTFLAFYGNVSAKIKVSLWVSSVSTQILSAESAMSVRSEIGCLRWGQTHWNCVTTAYDVSSKMCYLHPVLDTSGSGPLDDVHVYSASDPTCKIDDVQILNDADVTTWHRSLTSLEGDVTCKTDFMQVGDDSPTVRCLATGQWETNSNCKQRIWRNDQISLGDPLLLPDTPSAGWSACCVGAPTEAGKVQFHIELWGNSGNLVLVINPRLNIPYNHNVTYLAVKNSGGSWVNLKRLQDPDPAFPFAHGQQFNLTVTATGSHSLELHADGNFYTNVTVPANINTITNIKMTGDVRMSFVDVWRG